MTRLTRPGFNAVTDCFVAKISESALADGELLEHLPYSSSDYTIDFLAPEVLSGDLVSTPMDAFSFAGIILYVFNQKWPRISIQKKFNPRAVTLSEVEKRQEHLECMIADFAVLKQLVVDCLDNDPTARPTMESVSKKVQRDKDMYAKQTPSNTTFNASLKKNAARLKQDIIKQVYVYS